MLFRYSFAEHFYTSRSTDHRDLDLGGNKAIKTFYRHTTGIKFSGM